MTTDPRSIFSNGDIAHSSLKNKVSATTFSDGIPMQVRVPVSDIYRSPDGPNLERQTLYGHPVCLLDEKNGFMRDELSGYVGYARPNELRAAKAATHRVQSRATLLFAAPDFKCPNPVAIPCGSFLTIVDKSDKFSETDDGLFAVTAHLMPLSARQSDLAATAELHLGTPYLWGGNSAFGIDCSGLVQIACQAANITCPGDSDQQQAHLGTLLPEATSPQRNDLMFWKGHVALVVDENTLIHANAHHMAVVFEDLDTALKRIEAQGDGPMLAHKRL